MIGDCAYLLGNGIGKQRATREARGREVKRFRVLLLSTGEVGVASAMNAAGQKTRAGQEVRVVELLADAGHGHGMLDSLAGYADKETFYANVLAASERDHGCAGPVFIEKLVSNAAQVATDARQAIRDFVEQNCRSQADGQVKRVAARFGLVAYAGELATEYGLTGWRHADVRTAVEAAFDAWLSRRGTEGAREPAQMIAQVRAFIEAHQHSRFLEIKKRENSYGMEDEAITHQRTNLSAGYKKTETTDDVVFLIHREVFKTEVCQGFDHLAVCKALQVRGFLVTDNEAGRWTKRHHVPGHQTKQHFFTVNGSALLAAD